MWQKLQKASPFVYFAVASIAAVMLLLFDLASATPSLAVRGLINFMVILFALIAFGQILSRLQPPTAISSSPTGGGE